MKTMFPKLGSFLPKQTKNSKSSDEDTLVITRAYVFKGNLIATDKSSLLVFNLREFLKFYHQLDDSENPTEAIELIDRLVEELEGKALTAEFFNIFSKPTKINDVQDGRIFVSKEGLHSEFLLDEVFPQEKLEDYLINNWSIHWKAERTEQGNFAVPGSVIKKLQSVAGGELIADNLVFKRTTDDHAAFCLTEKEFFYGIVPYALEGESSVMVFIEGNDFFESF